MAIIVHVWAKPFEDQLIDVCEFFSLLRCDFTRAIRLLKLYDRYSIIRLAIRRAVLSSYTSPALCSRSLTTPETQRVRRTCHACLALLTNGGTGTADGVWLSTLMERVGLALFILNIFIWIYAQYRVWRLVHDAEDVSYPLSR